MTTGTDETDPNSKRALSYSSLAQEHQDDHEVEDEADVLPMVVTASSLKQTRVLDAYGQFGENEPLIPGEKTPFDSWRLTNSSGRIQAGNPNKRNNKHKNNNAPASDSAWSTGIRYKNNGVPEYSVRSFFRHLNFAVPSRWDVVEVTATGTEVMLSYRHIGELYDLPPTAPNMRRLQFGRPLRRRIFLFLTEPDTSVASAIFFFVLIVTITIMNVVMMMQTCDSFQFVPDDCRSCGGPISYMFDDETVSDEQDNFSGDYECVCPPTPLPWTEALLKVLIMFFSIEWVMRILTFCPIPINNEGKRKGTWDYVNDWVEFLTSWTTVLDFLAIFPYYMELAFQTNGLMSLRLLRLFRVVQLVRLGQYNATFMSLASVLSESLLYLKVLMGALLFAAAFFGSMIYWLEKGDWKYWPETQSYQFIRLNPQGIEEISPFKSIPDTFWWFFVTATTVGYGDFVPTSTPGKYVAFFAMMTGVLVIAFPVSVFSDLWQKELKKAGALETLDDEDDDNENENEIGDNGDDDMCDNDDAEKQWSPNSHVSKSSSIAAARQLVEELDKGSPALQDRKTAGVGQQKQQQKQQIMNSVTSLPDEALRPNMRPHMKRSPSSSSLKGNQVAIDCDDLINLLSHVQSMQESQREIKMILRKYRLQLRKVSRETKA